MDVVIPERLVRNTEMTEGELLREIAVMLYEKEKPTLGQASELARMSRLDFR